MSSFRRSFPAARLFAVVLLLVGLAAPGPGAGSARAGSPVAVPPKVPADAAGPVRVGEDGRTYAIGAPGLPYPDDLTLGATDRLRTNGRLVMDIYRGGIGKARDGSAWQLVVLGKFGAGYDAVKVYLKKPVIFSGTGAVYHFDRLKEAGTFFTFWPGSDGLSRLTSKDRKKITKGVGVDRGVYGGFPYHHTTVARLDCAYGRCLHIRAWPKDKTTGERWDVYVLEDSMMVEKAERIGADGVSLWRYSVEETWTVDGRLFEKRIRLVEDRDKRETELVVVEADLDLLFVGNIFDKEAFVDSGWKKRKKTGR